MHAPQASTFKARADAALADRTLKLAIDRTTGNAERKRAAAVSAFPEFEAARERGKAIKNHVVANLDHYLEMFERNAKAAGAKVHWAADDAEAEHDARHHEDDVLRLQGDREALHQEADFFHGPFK